MYEVYHIPHPKNLNNVNEGYVGVSVNTKERFKQHMISKYIVGNGIRKYKLTYDDVKILEVFVNKEDAYEYEKMLRPQGYIGWNINSGGRGGWNVVNDNPNYINPATGRSWYNIKNKDKNEYVFRHPEDIKKDWIKEGPKGLKSYKKPDGTYTHSLFENIENDWVEECPSAGYKSYKKPDGTYTKCLPSNAENEWILEGPNRGYQSYKKPNGSIVTCKPNESNDDWVMAGVNKGFEYYKRPDGTYTSCLSKDAKDDWIKERWPTNKDTKNKIKNSKLGTRLMNNGIKNIYVQKHVINHYLWMGWKFNTKNQ